jgi:predicted amidohydrolase
LVRRKKSRSSRVAVAQMNCELGDVAANLGTIEQLARQASRSKPDLVCFPELATTGYTLGRRWLELAEPIPGPSSEALGEVARRHGFVLVCGIAERDANTGRVYDSAVVIDPRGKVVGVYRKVHLWAEERNFFTPGLGFPIFRTEKLGAFGVGICYDVEFPESARSMALQGANLILFPSAEMRPMENHVETYVKSRSAENCVYVAFSNRVGTEKKTVFFGRSQIVSPQCKVLAKAGPQDQLAVADLDYSLLERERATTLPYLKQLVPSAYRATGETQLASKEQARVEMAQRNQTLNFNGRANSPPWAAYFCGTRPDSSESSVSLTQSGSISRSSESSFR